MYINAFFPLEAFIAPVIVLFYIDYIGVSFLQYSNFIASLFILNMVLEIPSGTISDYIGRRKALVVGKCIYSIGLVLLLLLSGVKALIFAAIFFSFGGSLVSGNLQSICYEAYLLAGKEANFKTILSRSGAIAIGVSAFAAYIGGRTADTNLFWPMLFDLVALLINIIFSCFFFMQMGPQEPIANKTSCKSSAFIELAKIKTVKNIILKPKFLFSLFLSISCFVVLRVSLNFYQPILSNSGWSGEELGILFTSAILLSAVFSFCVSRFLTDHLSFFQTAAIFVLVLIACAILFSTKIANFVPFILAFFLHQIIRVIIPAVAINAQQSVMPAGYAMRTTVTSICQFVQSLMLALGLLLTGYFVDNGTNHTTVLVYLHVVAILAFIIINLGLFWGGKGLVFSLNKPDLT